MVDGLPVPGTLDPAFESSIAEEGGTSRLVLHVPLPFWFARSSVSNPFPLGALARDDAVLKLCLKPAASIVTPDPPEDAVVLPLITLVTDNVHVMPDFSNRTRGRTLFQQHGAQVAAVDLQKPVQRLEIICNRSVRRILWTVTGPPPAEEIVSNSVSVSRLLFDGHNVAPTAPKNDANGLRTDSFYSQVVQPYLYGSSGGVAGVYSHSFALCQSDRPYMGPKLPIYPFLPADPAYGSPYSDQASGAFDMSVTRNFLEIQLNEDVVPIGSSIHVLFEVYNVLEYSLDEMKT
jgi:hypothetical protein